MGIWTRRDSLQMRSSSPLNGIDRKVIRFRRLVEQHGEVLALFEDLKEKRSGEYILDRQYIEACLDRAYEAVRRILYDMHVLCDSDSGEGYDQLDGLRSISEKILRAAPDNKQGLPGDEEADWETLALQALFVDLTRVTAFGSVAESGKATGRAEPRSLAEWAGWAHVKAAEWIADNLPAVSAREGVIVREEASEALGIQVLVRRGRRGAEDLLRRCLAGEASGRAEGLSLLPLVCFLDGLRRSSDGTAATQLCLAGPRKRTAGAAVEPLYVYAVEEFLLFRLPSFLPIRLFGCSLSVHEHENLIYFFGESLPSPFEQPASGSSLSDTEPVAAHRCEIAGRYMHWATRFSCAQVEERVRMLGHSLSECVTLCGRAATQEDVRRCLQEGIRLFLRSVAFRDRSAAVS